MGINIIHLILHSSQGNYALQCNGAVIDCELRHLDLVYCYIIPLQPLHACVPSILDVKEKQLLQY
jgi:hypothetical protein